MAILTHALRWTLGLGFATVAALSAWLATAIAGAFLYWPTGEECPTGSLARVCFPDPPVWFEMLELLSGLAMFGVMLWAVLYVSRPSTWTGEGESGVSRVP